MRTKILTILLLAVIGATVDVAAQQQSGKGFGFAAEGAWGIVLTDKEGTGDSNFRLDAIATAGYHFNNHLFAGVSTSAADFKHLPLFASVRYAFTDGKVRPYIELRGGAGLKDFKASREDYYGGALAVGFVSGGFTVSLGYRYTRVGEMVHVESVGAKNVLSRSGGGFLCVGYYF